MNKGLKLDSFTSCFFFILFKRNTDLMNKGLKLVHFSLAYRNNQKKRNTDLMNKGLKLFQVIDKFIKLVYEKKH